jgi:2C-methyl-D-erythritol 2,4-cyclodiphosphate synthase
MSNINNPNRDTHPTTETNSDNFVSQLRQTVNDTDWFLNNISAKWEQENPELAKQRQEILKDTEINDTVQP